MKKASMESLVNYIDTHNVEELFAIKDELTAELAKGKAKADANREVYAEIHDKVIDVLTSATAPVTAQEIADETGIARGKIVYGLKNYWSGEVVVDTTGKANTYRLA
jgi:GTP-sensing pleiotropic transcriptional regulator CodY